MSDETMLHYVKSIADGVIRLEEKMDLMSADQNDRISSLETTREQQRGIMIGGGTMVTLFAGAVTWLVNIFSHGPQQ